MKLLNSKKLYSDIKKIARLQLKVFTLLLVLILMLEMTGFTPNIAWATESEKKTTKIDKILENLLDKNFIECMNPTLCAVLYIPYYNIWIFVWGFRHPALLIETVNKPGMSLIWGDVLGENLKIAGVPLLSGGTTTPNIGNMQYNEVHIFGLDYSPIKVCSGGSQGAGLDMSEMMEKMQELLGDKKKEEKTGAHVVLARPTWSIMENPMGDYCVSDRLQLVYPTSSGPFKPGQMSSKWAPKKVSKEIIRGDFAYVYWRGAACIQIQTSSSGGGSGGGGGGTGAGTGGAEAGTGASGSGAGAGGTGAGKGKKKGLSWPQVVQYMITALTTASQYGSKDQQTAGTAVGTTYGGYKTYETGKKLGFFGGGQKGKFFGGASEEGKGEETKGEKDKSTEGESGGDSGLSKQVSKALSQVTIPYICGGSGSGSGGGGSGGSGTSFCVMGKATDDILNFYYLSELDAVEWRFSIVEMIKRLYQKVAGLGEWFKGDKKENGEKKGGEVSTTADDHSGYEVERYSTRDEDKDKEEGWERRGQISGIMEKIGCEFYVSEKISKGGKCIGRWGPLNPRRGHYIHHDPHISSALTMWRAIDIMFTEKEKEGTGAGAGVGAGASGSGAGAGGTGAGK